MEFMGLHVPGASFIPPDTPLRDRLTEEATHRAAAISQIGETYTPLAEVLDEKAMVNAMVGLLATGGSTNHTLHLPAIARAAGIIINWQDFDDLSKIVPLLTRVYPNGQADVNHFHAAGGIGFVISALLKAGLLHDDVTTIYGQGLSAYASEPMLQDDELVWRPAPDSSGDSDIVSDCDAPFDPEGGMRLLQGDLGRGVIKTSAVKQAHRIVEAPARVFNDQNDVLAAFEAGKLERDCIVVLRFQGPAANGMPELHKLTPALSVLQDRGFHVALITDGRMSGASGKVPAAIHMTPEAKLGGPLGKINDGDVIILDSVAGTISIKASDFQQRSSVPMPQANHQAGLGRQLFRNLKERVGSAESGASLFE